MKPKTLILLYITLLPFITPSKFLQHITKKNICPKIPLTKLALLIVLSEDDEPLFESSLTESERAPYEEKVQLKRGFAQTMSYVPQSFSPEKNSYWSDLRFLVIIFIFCCG